MTDATQGSPRGEPGSGAGNSNQFAAASDCGIRLHV